MHPRVHAQSQSHSTGSQSHRVHLKASSRSSAMGATAATPHVSVLAAPSCSSSSSRSQDTRSKAGRDGGGGGGGSCASVASAASTASSSLGLGLGALRGLGGTATPTPVMEFADGLQTNDEDINMLLMVEWARAHKRTKQAHAAAAAAAANGGSYLRPLDQSVLSGGSRALSSSAQSSNVQSSSIPLYNYSPPSISRGITPSVSLSAASHSSRPSPEPHLPAAQSSTHGHTRSGSHAMSTHSSPAIAPIPARKRVRARSREDVEEQMLPLPLPPPAVTSTHASTVAAAASASASASSARSALAMSVSLSQIRAQREKEADMVSEHSDEQIEVKFHADEMVSSPAAIVSPVPQPERELPAYAAVAAVPATSMAPAVVAAAAAVEASPFTRLVSLVPSFLATLLSLMELPCRIHYMQVCRRWRDEVLSTSSIWAGSRWVPGGSRPCLGGTMRGPSGDGCAVFARLNQTYGVGAEHARWVVPPLPPHSFLLSRLQHLDLRPAGGVNGDSSASARMAMVASSASVVGGVGSGAPGARGAHSQWSDAHLVLLPYFSSLLTLDLSYFGSTEPGELNSTGSSTQSAMAGGSAPRVSGVVLGRVALLPQLQRLVLDHCDWVDDEALACLRNKYNCRLALTPGEAPPSSAGCSASAAEAAMAAASAAGTMQSFSFASPAAAAPTVAFLPPAHSLPALTHLSLEFLPRLTPRGLSYLLGDAGLPGLRELNLSNSAGAVSGVSMRALEASNAHSLRSLNLGWCGGMGRAASPAAALATLAPLARMPQLAHLELRGWAELREETFQAFCDQTAAGAGAAAASSSSSVTSLSSSSSFLSAASTSLRSLNLRGCSSLSSRALSLLSRFSSTLLELDLSDCRSLCDSTLRLLGFSLHALQKLVLWNAPLVTDRGVEALLCGGQSLQSCWSLQQAHHSRAVHALGAAAAGPWWEASLPGSPCASSVTLPCLLHSLRSLSLSSAPLLTGVSFALLRFCTRLEELDVRDAPQLGDAAVAALCAEFVLPNGARCGALRRSLRTLHLSRLGPGMLTSECGAALRHLRALTSLDVSWNESIDDELLVHLFAPAVAAQPATAGIAATMLLDNDVATQSAMSASVTEASTMTGAAGPISAADPSSSPPPSGVQRLNLARCAITERGLQLLGSVAVQRAGSPQRAPLSDVDVRYCPLLSLAQLDALLQRVAPACTVEHTAAPPDEDDAEDAHAAISSEDSDSEADMPVGFMSLAVAPQTLPRPQPDRCQGMHVAAAAAAAAAASLPPLPAVTPLPPSPATVALMAAAARAPSACSGGSASRRSSRSSNGLGTLGHGCGAPGVASADVDDPSADPFRVECQVVANEDEWAAAEAEADAAFGFSSGDSGDGADDDDEGADSSESDSADDYSDDSMVSHSGAQIHTQTEEDEQGLMWDVHH